VILRGVLRATRSAQGDSESLEELVSIIATSLARLICGLRGHSDMLHPAPNGLSLRCTLCGHETPGWEIVRASFRIGFRWQEPEHPASTNIRDRPVDRHGFIAGFDGRTPLRAFNRITFR
jgi:hypothetical protein